MSKSHSQKTIKARMLADIAASKKGNTVGITSCSTCEIIRWNPEACHEKGRKPGYLMGIQVCGICSFYGWWMEETGDEDNPIFHDRCRSKNGKYKKPWPYWVCEHFKLKSKLKKALEAHS